MKFYQKQKTIIKKKGIKKETKTPYIYQTNETKEDKKKTEEKREKEDVEW